MYSDFDFEKKYDYDEVVTYYDKERKAAYKQANFNPQRLADKQTEAKVFCPQGHCLYAKIKYGTLYNKKGIRPTAEQWQDRDELTLLPHQYEMIGKKCKECEK